MDWIGWIVVVAMCATVVGLVRESRRRTVVGRDPAEVSAHLAAAAADRRRHRLARPPVDLRLASSLGG